MERKNTRQLSVGGILIGGNAPVTIQSMTSGYTHEIDSCVAEINRLDEAGADIVRVAVPKKEDTLALEHILPQVSVPIVADVHFHFQRALESIEAGVQKIRLNPGNISDTEQVHKVIDACKDSNIPIRVGVNEGSIVERKDKQKRQQELTKFFADQKLGHLLALMIAKVEEYLELFEQRDFNDICISAKSMDTRLTIDIYKELSNRFDYPLHLGVTHAGPRETGSIRSITAIGSLLSQGIGDTFRISYASDSVYEVEDGVELLNCLGLRERKGVELIACPSCGRIQVDLFSLVNDVQNKLKDEINLPIKVAVMGCVVNGPGEAEGADVAVFAGNRKGIIYVQGERVANVKEEEILDRLLLECKLLQDRVLNGKTKLGEKACTIVVPEPTVEGKFK
ncbi:MAG: flavodoxin-dependent (E)-4-hydroxy-3-methylbut-2-enyl-diphosphate synthase [Phycisphaerales bacterium]|nr:flavodoxin-dependent (E)-4-hydroxy-3-methylbut-2-enyl-diphosphate synthase [Phycisphaerales bacterium]